MQATLQPQEVEVFYILPAIRREFSIALKDLGKTQRQIALLLGVTEAAISYYMNQKRGSDVKFPYELALEIHKAAPNITDHESMIRETQHILDKAKLSKITCELHKQVVSSIPQGCDVCFK